MEERKEIPKKRKKISPRRAALAMELAVNGGNVSRAGRKVGYSKRQAFRAAHSPEVQGLLAGYRDVTEAKMLAWSDLAVDAQNALRSALNAVTTYVTKEDISTYPDYRTRVMAAKEILNRHLGMPRQSVEVSGEIETNNSVDEGVFRAIMALMLGRGLSLVEAHQYVLAHPTEMKQWLSSEVN